MSISPPVAPQCVLIRFAKQPHKPPLPDSDQADRGRAPNRPNTTSNDSLPVVGYITVCVLTYVAVICAASRARDRSLRLAMAEQSTYSSCNGPATPTGTFDTVSHVRFSCRLPDAE